MANLSNDNYNLLCDLEGLIDYAKDELLELRNDN